MSLAFSRRASVMVLFGLLTAVVVSAGPASAPTHAFENPIVTGPIASPVSPGDPGRNYPFYSTPMDLKKVGYVEEEYFISGTATRYTIPATPGDATSIGTIPYRTRIVVRRPASSKKFTGVVVVDWQNVTAGYEIDSEWTDAAEFFVRSGWAWVGASVQRIGVHGFDPPNPLAGRGLRQWSPTRYGSLDVTDNGSVTDDSQSYDIYSQIAKILKEPGAVNPFRGMAVRRVYAGGISQSATFLVRYYNSVQSLANAYDGFLVGLGGGTPRLDVPAKVFKVYTENDVWLSQAAVRVPDTNSTHSWEIAGASHVGASSIVQDKNDFRAYLGGILARDFALKTVRLGECARPFSSNVEAWAVRSAAYAALDLWVTKNVKPPTAAAIQVSAAPPPPARATIVRNDHGIALGGIRLPRVALPVALNTGENAPLDANPLGRFCAIYGTHVPFDAAKLSALYPSRPAYVRDAERVVDALVRGGFLLKDDAQTLMRHARADR